MKYKELVNKMTVEEKVSLLTGKTFWTTQDIESLNISSMFLADGPHGMRKQQTTSDHLGLNAGVSATCFPTAATIANSWSTDLGEEIGTCLGEEAVSMRVNMVLGPGLNIKRSPLCGRNFEYFSEDPYLSGKMAAAYVKGIQKNGISACPKHFAANSQEVMRMANDSVMDERTFREIYLTGFEMAVKEARPKAIMSSYNKINGTYANENEHLLQEILRDEWGFDGLVVSDWGGSNDRFEGLIAGSHLEMPGGGGESNKLLEQAFKEGRLSAEMLDKRVDEFLDVLFHTEIKASEPYTFDKEKHHDLACKAAGESVVLLKNTDNLLPLKEGTKVAVIGDFAATPRYQGAGSSLVNPTSLDTTLDCIKNSGLVLEGFEQGFNRNGNPDIELKKAACQLAKKAEVVLLYLGLAEEDETEGIDRSHMKISANQIDLLQSLVKENSNIVIALSCGAAVEMPWIDSCKAVVHGYLAGQAGAGAILNVIEGKVNPSGKLAESYPFVLEDVSSSRYYPGLERTSEYREGIFVGYRYYDTAEVPVRFPFGYGLSYTSFSYSDLRVSKEKVSFQIKNTGDRAGAEVAQVYVSAPGLDVFVPEKELKGFAKVFLEPGESKEVTVPLNETAFRYFNVETNRFETEGGSYKILVGASSKDICLQDEIEIEGSGAKSPYVREDVDAYYQGNVADITDKEFEKLLGHVIPEAKWDRTKPLERNDTIAQMFYAKSPIARLVYKVLNGRLIKAQKSGKVDINILFIYYVPFRGLAKLTGGIFNLEMVDALLEAINGHFFKGMGHLIGANRRKGRKS